MKWAVLGLNQYLRKPDPITAYSWYKRAADQKNADAQKRLRSVSFLIRIADAYQELADKDKRDSDYKAAVEWYIKAIQADNEERLGGEKLPTAKRVKVLYTLGEAYFQGKGVNQDKKIAFEYFKGAAEEVYFKKTNAYRDYYPVENAQAKIIEAYANGELVAKNPDEIFELIRRYGRYSVIARMFAMEGVLSRICGVKKDFKKALEWCEIALKEDVTIGGTAAAATLKLYIEGVNSDRKKAEEGDKELQYNLGIKYFYGKGTTMIDVHFAREMYLKAATQGHMKACFSLGYSYAYSIEAGIDVKKACEWYQKAADLGHVDAMSELAWSYAFGIGVAKDEKQACELLIKSAQKGELERTKNLSVISKHGLWRHEIMVKARPEYFTPEGIELVKKLAAAVLIELPRALEAEFKAVKEKATSGDIESQFDLANSFNTGKGTQVDKKMACEWYQKAATSGHAEAQYCFGTELISGETVAKNLEGACGWLEKSMALGFEKAKLKLEELAKTGMVEAQTVLLPKELRGFYKAAAAGDTVGQVMLAHAYFEGRLIPVDKKKACDWLQKAADQGDALAQMELGHAYLSGNLGIAVDFKKGCSLFRKVAEQGDADAQYCLAMLYTSGHPEIPLNEEEACIWYKKAAEGGNANAVVRLKEIADKGNQSAAIALIQLTITANTRPNADLISFKKTSLMAEAETKNDKDQVKDKEGSSFLPRFLANRDALVSTVNLSSASIANAGTNDALSASVDSGFNRAELDNLAAAKR